MSRWLGFLFACLAFTFPAGAAPPPGPSERPGLWLPATAGDNLVFEETRSTADGKTTRRITRTVVDVHRSDTLVAVAIKEERPPLESKVFARNEKAGLESWTEIYHLTDAGVFLLARDLCAFDPPCQVLRLPLRSGDTWEVNNPAVFPSAIKYTTGNEEEVEVPAGKFKAVRIENESVLKDGGTIRVTHWISPGLGVVKTKARFHDGWDAVQVLKSFTPGKK